MRDFSQIAARERWDAPKGEDGFPSLLTVTNISFGALPRGAGMKFFVAVAFACLSLVALPAFADDPTPVPSDRFPGWVTMTRETGTVFFYCRAPRICGEGSIVSFHFHDLPAPTKAEIREKQREPRLPITCRNAGKYDTCQYPNAIDKKGRPTHWRPLPGPSFPADYFHSGHLSAHMPAGSRTHFLITLASSAASYQQAKKNYAMFEAYLGKAIAKTDLAHRFSL